MATQPHILPSNVVVIRFSKPLLACIQQVLTLRSMSLESYIIELAESDCAPFRLGKIRSDFLTPAGAKTKRIETQNDSRSKLTPEQIQRALFLFDTEDLPVNMIARRFGCGASTIHRILREREESATHVPVSVTTSQLRARRANKIKWRWQ